MTTLKEFLLARVAEDEQLAQLAIDGHGPTRAWRGPGDPCDDPHIEHWSPWRVMSGCVAKRLILTAHADVDLLAEDGTGEVRAHVCATCTEHGGSPTAWPCYTLRVLALDYVDHPDYRWEWSPERARSRPA